MNLRNVLLFSIVIVFFLISITGCEMPSVYRYYSGYTRYPVEIYSTNNPPLMAPVAPGFESMVGDQSVQNRYWSGVRKGNAYQLGASQDQAYYDGLRDANRGLIAPVGVTYANPVEAYYLGGVRKGNAYNLGAARDQAYYDGLRNSINRRW